MNSESTNTEQNRQENQPDVLTLTGENHPDVVGDDSKAISRRKFLSKASIALAGLGGVAVVIPVAVFMISPLFQTTPEVWRPVGRVDSFVIGETVKVTFPDASPEVWAGIVAQTAAWLRRLSQDQFKAYSVNCTHLGCPVSWIPSAYLFVCPCHGGVYYPDGRVAAGPPPLPLAEYKVRIAGQQVEILASGIPITR